MDRGCIRSIVLPETLTFLRTDGFSGRLCCERESINFTLKEQVEVTTHKGSDLFRPNRVPRGFGRVPKKGRRTKEKERRERERKIRKQKKKIRLKLK